MSLLMEALKKAERKPEGAGGNEYSLEPLEEKPTRNEPTTHDIQAATNLFEAKQSSAGRFSSRQMVAGFALLAVLFAVGYGAYLYYGTSAPPLVVPLRTTALAPVAATPEPAVPAAATALDSPPHATLPEPLPPVEVVSVKRDTTLPEVNPVLMQAYQDLQAGRFDQAHAGYQQLLLGDPGNSDALLGMAVVATQRGDVANASQYYLQILERDPHNALAQARLMGLLNNADPITKEERLKKLLARDPSASVHFALGNLYAQQQRWSEAEHAYFEAYRLQPDNPDHAYNLAVSLDQLDQTKPALNYYLRAQQLAQEKGVANFNREQLTARIGELQSSRE
ncbi:MAG: tetratricopeptide repeat protein [Burkholderiales bacterium]